MKSDAFKKSLFCLFACYIRTLWYHFKQQKHKFIFINSVKLLLFLSINNVKPSVKVLDLRLLVFEKVLKVIEFE